VVRGTRVELARGWRPSDGASPTRSQT